MAIRSVKSRHQSKKRSWFRWVLALIIIIVWWHPFNRTVETQPVVTDANLDAFLVYLSPGDGGNELGGVYPRSGSPEIKGKDINLAIALATKRALEKEGITVKLSRESDQFVDALDRKRQAEQARAAVAIALFTDTYYDDPLKTGFTIIDYKKVDWTSNYKQRAALAAELNKALIDRLQEEQTASQGVFERNSAFVIDGPTIAIVVGYLSNEAERARLVDEAYQWKVANAITDALVYYRDTLRWQKNPPSGLVPEQTTDALHLPF